MTALKPNTKEALQRLQNEAENIINPLGYEIVALEQKTAPSPTSTGRTLLLIIDFLNHSDTFKRISLDDCVLVNKAVDALFENTDLLEGHYTLEVSSPGLERPLRRLQDYERFTGHQVRIYTTRTLETAEIENPDYLEKNKKQKNFYGKLEGLTTDMKKIKINMNESHITIPFSLISKAHLEEVP